MKKIIAIISAMMLTVACGNEKFGIENNSDVQDTDSILGFDITINMADDADTKAYAKTAFANNDVVYIFFSVVGAPKYLEAKYNSSTQKWDFTPKNGLTSANLESAYSKKMTAIYMPYGSNLTVLASDNKYVFDDTYTGYVLRAEQVDYTISSGVLSGTINLGYSGYYIQFDVTGFVNGHEYEMYQENIQPSVINYIDNTGKMFFSSHSYGSAVKGYADGEHLTFCGMLSSTALSHKVDYQFTIVDRTAGIIYYRDAGQKTLSSRKYIGLGSIADDSKWSATEFVDLSLPSGTLWAKCNLGADTETNYGDYYAWGETTPYYEEGYATSTQQVQWRSGKTTGYTWNSYSFNPSHDGTTFTKYTGSDYSVLESEDDAATVNIAGGLWRMPTIEEFNELVDDNNCTWVMKTGYNGTGTNGYLVTSKSNGASIFLPFAGYRQDLSLTRAGGYGAYWSSTYSAGTTYYAGNLFFNSTSHGASYGYMRRTGLPIRPVCVLP